MGELLQTFRNLGGGKGQGSRIVLRAVHSIESEVKANSSNGDSEDVRNAREKPLGLSVSCTQLRL